MKLLWILSAPLVASRVIREQQKPTVEAKGAAPAIGIHLTTSYAIAAARYKDGTVEDLVRVEAGAEYIELMAQWANVTEYPCDSSIRNVLCNAQRTARYRHIGNVGILSSFLQEVKSAIEEKLGDSITDVLPAFPPLVAVDREDIAEAFAHAGLNWVQVERQQKPILEETNAAYAGSGYGLCNVEADSLQCEEEESGSPFQQVLFLNFDNSSFSATLQDLQSAYQQRTSASSLKPMLGWWNLPVYEMYEAARKDHWTQIRDTISSVAGSSTHPPRKIILLGEHAKDPEFLEAAKAALFDLFEFDVSPLLQANADVNSETVAARGAAELASRSRDRRIFSGESTVTEVLEL